MKNRPFYWLFSEPYVHGIVRNNNVLFYNTLNKKHLLFRGNPEIAGLASRLIDPANGSVIPVTSDEINNQTVIWFIRQFRHKFMGDLLPGDPSKNKPVNLIPLPIIKRLKFSLIDHLHEVTLHLSSTNESLLSCYHEAFRQFIFPVYDASGRKNLPREWITTLLDQFPASGLVSVNLTGTEMIGQTDSAALIKKMRKLEYRCKVHTFMTEAGLLEWIVPDRKTTLVFFLLFPMPERDLEHLGRMVTKNPGLKRTEFHLVVRSAAELEEATEIIDRFGIKNSYFKPFFTGSNMDFFESQVFISEQDILGSRPSQKQVLSRLIINENDYGKITIMPDGTLFANLNDDPLANLPELELVTIIRQEYQTGRSWNRRRMDQAPCNRCIYQFICPPVSNYELYLKKFNLCDMDIDAP